MGRSNVTAMRELAIRRAAIARAIKQPLPKGGALRKLTGKRKQRRGPALYWTDNGGLSDGRDKEEQHRCEQ